MPQLHFRPDTSKGSVRGGSAPPNSLPVHHHGGGAHGCITDGIGGGTPARLRGAANDRETDAGQSDGERMILLPAAD
jgi:hypothetical protein